MTEMVTQVMTMGLATGVTIPILTRDGDVVVVRMLTKIGAATLVAKVTRTMKGRWTRTIPTPKMKMRARRTKARKKRRENRTTRRAIRKSLSVLLDVQPSSR